MKSFEDLENRGPRVDAIPLGLVFRSRVRDALLDATLYWLRALKFY